MGSTAEKGWRKGKSAKNNEGGEIEARNRTQVRRATRNRIKKKIARKKRNRKKQAPRHTIQRSCGKECSSGEGGRRRRKENEAEKQTPITVNGCPEETRLKKKSI